MLCNITQDTVLVRTLSFQSQHFCLSGFSCIKYFVQGFPLLRCPDPLLNIVNVRCDIVYSGLCCHTEDEAERLCCLMFLFCIDVFQRSSNKKTLQFYPGLFFFAQQQMLKDFNHTHKPGSVHNATNKLVQECTKIEFSVFQNYSKVLNMHSH